MDGPAHTTTKADDDALGLSHAAAAPNVMTDLLEYFQRACQGALPQPPQEHLHFLFGLTVSALTCCGYPVPPGCGRFDRVLRGKAGTTKLLPCGGIQRIKRQCSMQLIDGGRQFPGIAQRFAEGEAH